MNPFLILLGLLLVAAWLGTGVALIVIPVRYLRSTDLFERVCAWLAVAGGVALLLLFAALITGGVSVADTRPAGCYYIHRELVGKTIVTKYDPIECHGTPIP